MKRIILSLTFLFLATACSTIPSQQIYTQPSVKKESNPKEIVFIHGMFMTPKCWDEWQKYFKVKGYTVSAPAWPLHEGSVESLRAEDRLPELAKLELSQVLEFYRKILQSKKTKPILVGHSMGGLISQILLNEGLAAAAVTLDSAAPNGMIVFKWSFLRSNWKIASPFTSLDKPITANLEEFTYAFSNAQEPDVQKKLYEDFYVPESRRLGKGALDKIAKIDSTKSRGPLLLIAGEKDHIIPKELTYKNFKHYKESPAMTEYLMMPDRDHSLLVGKNWEEVAGQVNQWLDTNLTR